MTSKSQSNTKIEWDSGTAYDFFISYMVLARPKQFGLRSAWASGMRARLQPADREVLDTSLLVIQTAGQWLHSMSPPKDVGHCLRALAEIPAAERLPRLVCSPREDSQCSPAQALLNRVWRSGTWDKATLKEFHDIHASAKHGTHKVPSDRDLSSILDAWANAESFGEQYLRALQNYQDVFFAEEERRIAPKLEVALEHAKARATELPFEDLIEELSQGLRYEGTVNLDTLTLVPSYWISPFVQTIHLNHGHRIWIFGARTAQDSIVPGDPVPDALRASLKALADPTRLRILRYLNREPLTMSELTKRLRLRMPTVMHHLSALRLAGLVSIHMEAGEKGPRQRYGTRTEGLDAAMQSLRQFIEDEQTSST
jgi:DNA-binding transcriptional ArsR family regulator